MRFPILKNKKYSFIFSGILIALSLFFLIHPSFRLSMGIDFTGGSEIIWNFGDEKPNNEKIENIYISTLGQDIGAKASNIQNSTEVIVKSHILSTDEQNALLQKFQSEFQKVTIDGVSTINSSLGDYFQAQAFQTLIFAIIAIILFLAWAFRNVPKGISSWRFGMAAIVALVHDVVIIAGLFSFLGQFIPTLEVDTLFVTALLTVLGFSVHDTIVVFDRLRENLKGKKSCLLEQIAEDSLWQTMGRSIHTSVSTLFVLLAILFWGAPSIFAFIFALASGILIGTYSSIFIATPLLVLWVQNDLEKNPIEDDEEAIDIEGTVIERKE